MVAEAFALVDVRDVDLDHRPVEGLERVKDGDGGMGEGGRIDDDARGGVPRLVDPVDQLALVVGLPEVDDQPVRGGGRDAQCLDVGEGGGAVDLRLSLAEEVEVGSVEHEDRAVVHPASMP